MRREGLSFGIYLVFIEGRRECSSTRRERYPFIIKFTGKRIVKGSLICRKKILSRQRGSASFALKVWERVFA